MARKLTVSLLLFLMAGFAFGTTYYVDSSGGNDGNSGTGEFNAWQTLTNVNSTAFSAGDSILFKAGGYWTGKLNPKGSGTSGNPIIIDMYGTGNKPIIDGNGSTGDGVLYFHNQEYWEANNLELTNDAGSGGDRRGVSITASNYGTVDHIHLKNLDIHDIKGIVAQTSAAKRTGGINIRVLDDATMTRFNDVLIENCTIATCDGSGISNEADTSFYPGTSGWQQRKYTNYIIRGNSINDISKNAIIFRMSDSSCLVEYNLCWDTAYRTGTGNTIFSRSCLGSVFQYNEGYLNRTTDFDGCLYDADISSPECVFQYSYSHDNNHGLFWMCTTNTDNDVIVRYNISRNDKGIIFCMNYAHTSAYVYNNTVYIPEHLSPRIVDERRDAVKTYYFYNNIIYNASPTATYQWFDGNRTFDYNIFYGYHPADEPSDPHKLTSDPMLINPGSGSIGLDTVAGYKLQDGSPAIDSGMEVPGNGGQDYWGNPVPYNGTTDRGAHEYGSEDDVVLDSISSDPTNISPIPVTVTFSKSKTGFDTSDIVVTNAAVGNFVGSGTAYSFDLTPLAAGTVTAQVPENVTDQGNTASNLLSKVYLEPLPSPWQNIDLDDSGPTGSAVYSDGVFSVAGGGADLSDPANGSQFVYRPLNGDGEITARVLSVDNTHPDAKAAVMIREDLTNSSLYAMAMVTAANGVGYQYIDTVGAGSPVQLFADGFVDCFSNWSGSNAFCSAATYPGGDAQSAKLNDNDYIQKNFSTFGYDSISVKYARYSTLASGVHFYAEWYDGSVWQTIEDISGSAGWLLQEFDLPAEANNKSNFAIRFRVESATNYAYVDMVEVISTPPASSGGTSAPNALNAPYWININRTGDTFTFYDSPDGVNWSQSGSASIPMANDVYIGMAVTAHQAGLLCTAEFDNVFYGLPADISGNGTVDIDDLRIFSGYWLQGSSIADIAPVPVDGIVDFLDFSVIAEYWQDSY